MVVHACRHDELKQVQIEQTLTVHCPLETCRATPGAPCRGVQGAWARGEFHSRRRRAARTALVNSTPCPKASCLRPAGEDCKARGPHRERWIAARSS